eukprot:403118-Pelagomonas_calceolata.AAC.2
MFSRQVRVTDTASLAHAGPKMAIYCQAQPGRHSIARHAEHGLWTHTHTHAPSAMDCEMRPNFWLLERRGKVREEPRPEEDDFRR